MGRDKTDEYPRVARGWRRGKPVEDPAKTKRWGYITAKPSEYLVHVRRGQVRLTSSGQGASVFKWPWDAVSIVPTSLQQLGFVADQVTREKVGVEVKGLAVFRIAEPLLAYRVLNFSYPERAQEKLEEALTSMFIGATRRLVANLGVEECLQKRKAALADELLHEVAPVVGGMGRPDDPTAQGWGVVIDTIEIQEVRVMSERVFADMQAPFRAVLERDARVARSESARAIALKEAANQQQVERARLAAEKVITEERAAFLRDKSLKASEDKRVVEETQLQTAHHIQTQEQERLAARAAAKAEAERVNRLREAETERIVKDRRIQDAITLEARDAQRTQARVEAERVKASMEAETERALKEQKLRDQMAVELQVRERNRLAREAAHAANIADEKRAAELAEAELAKVASQLEALEVQQRLEAMERAASLTARREESDVATLEGKAAAEVRAAIARAVELEAGAQARIITAEKLPELASAVGQRLGEVKLTQIGGSGLESVAESVQGVLELASRAIGGDSE
jgi:hypothetical protein